MGKLAKIGGLAAIVIASMNPNVQAEECRDYSALKNMDASKRAILADFENYRTNKTGEPECLSHGFVYLGQHAMEQKDFAMASKYLKVAIRLNRNNSTAWNNYGAMLYSMKQFKKAIDFYKKAESLNPDSPATQGSLGMSYFKLGQIQHAYRAFSRVLELDPGNKDAIRWKSYIERKYPSFSSTD